jgi:glycosyltransferase involved in cell wall biosynthesis
VISQQEGVLVPPENPAALAAGIRAAYMDRPAAMKRADAGRARLAAEFSIDSWLDRYDSLYASLKGKGQ